MNGRAVPHGWPANEVVVLLGWAIVAAAFAGHGTAAKAAVSAGSGSDASADADAGEAQRLSEDLERLAAKDAWTGVERTFLQLQGLGVPLSFDEWIRGAQSARMRGDIGRARDRLAAANALREERSVLDWMWDIASRYGDVALRCDPGSWLALEVVDAPTDPDTLKAITFARARVHDACAFEGMLPLGTYKLYDSPFTVSERADPVVVDVRGARLSRDERKTLRRAWLADD